MFASIKILIATVATTLSSFFVVPYPTPTIVNSPSPTFYSESMSNTCYKPDGSSYLTTQDCEEMEGYFSSPSPAVKSNLVYKDLIATPETDPIVSCKGKYGTYSVRSSVCSSSTECSDGYGKYIFESVESCKKRWEIIGSDLEKASKAYGDSIVQQYKVQSEYLLRSGIDFSPAPTPVFPDFVISPAPKPIMSFAPDPSPAPGGGQMYYKGY